MPSLRQLEYLVALADTRHFRRAAERSNTTQPTLSEQIKALEDGLGVQLVERSRAGAILTPTGSQVVQLARKMLGDANEIRSLAASEDGSPRGVLRLGLPESVSQPFLPTVLSTLRKAFPDLQVYARVDLPRALPGALEDGGYDFLILPLPIRGDDLAVVEVFREPIYLALPGNHPIALAANFNTADLRDQEFLTLGLSHDLHDFTQLLCEQYGARIRSEFPCTSLDILREMTVSGLGLSLLPGSYAHRSVEISQNLKLLPAPPPFAARTLSMAWRKSSPRGVMFERLAKQIIAAVAQQVTD